MEQAGASCRIYTVFEIDCRYVKRIWMRWRETRTSASDVSRSVLDDVDIGVAYVC